MSFEIDDGGRSAAGFKGDAGDCFVRAYSIAASADYRATYDAVNDFLRARYPLSFGKIRFGTARTGVKTSDARPFLEERGWLWVPTMGVGQGCKVHVRADELPAGRMILRLSRHYAAFVDGVLRDSYDSARDGTRCVYGYWLPPEAASD